MEAHRSSHRKKAKSEDERTKKEEKTKKGEVEESRGMEGTWINTAALRKPEQVRSMT